MRGTLVDTNYHHTLAWQRAFAESGAFPPAWRIHRHIGMGGDQLVGEVAGAAVESAQGDAIREAEGRLYAELIDEVAAALLEVGALSAVVVGDTVWDVEAAGRAELKAIGVLTGGFGEAELRSAGAVDVFESPQALHAGLDSTPLR